MVTQRRYSVETCCPAWRKVAYWTPAHAALDLHPCRRRTLAFELDLGPRRDRGSVERLCHLERDCDRHRAALCASYAGDVTSAQAAANYKERSCLTKRRYWSQVDALVMAARCVTRRSLGAGLGTYHCRNCRGWHLTRQL